MDYKHIDILVEGMTTEEAEILRDTILHTVESFGEKATIEITDTNDEEIMSTIDMDSFGDTAHEDLSLFGEDFNVEDFNP